jgi:hypothetical protein
VKTSILLQEHRAYRPGVDGAGAGGTRHNLADENGADICLVAARQPYFGEALDRCSLVSAISVPQVTRPTVATRGSLNE